MELNKFIQNTLKQIIEGVAESQTYAREKGAIINPSHVSFQKDGKSNRHVSAMPQDVQFDVGLTSTNTEGSNEGIGVFLGAINLGKNNKESNEVSAVTKVKFTVPIVLPTANSK
jgi:acyl-CoA thioesterase